MNIFELSLALTKTLRAIDVYNRSQSTVGRMLTEPGNVEAKMNLERALGVTMAAMAAAASDLGLSEDAILARAEEQVQAWADGQ